MYRVVHNKDIVPHIPTSIQGFYHEGEEVWYQSGMTSYKLCGYG